MAKKVIDKKKNETKKEDNLEPIIDTKKIMNELEKELKAKSEEYSQEIKNKIDEQIEYSVNKRMKEEEKRITRGKNGKIVRRDIIILLLCAVIGYFGYCLYDIDYFGIRTKIVKEPIENEQKNNENTEKEPIKEPEKEVLDSAYYIKTYGYLIDNLSINDNSIYSFYKTNTTKDNLTNELKLKIAYKNLKEEKKILDETNHMITFTPNDLLESAQSIFGNNVVLNNEMFTYNNIRFMYYNNTFIGFKEENSEIDFLYKIINAKEDNNKLIFSVIIAKNLNNKLYNSNDELVLETYNNEDIELYKDKLVTYQLTFEKTDNNYVFSNIE